jgi:hypothetical protein
MNVEGVHVRGTKKEPLVDNVRDNYMSNSPPSFTRLDDRPANKYTAQRPPSYVPFDDAAATSSGAASSGVRREKFVPAPQPKQSVVSPHNAGWESEYVTSGKAMNSEGKFIRGIKKEPRDFCRNKDEPMSDNTWVKSEVPRKFSNLRTKPGGSSSDPWNVDEQLARDMREATERPISPSDDDDD